MRWTDDESSGGWAPQEGSQKNKRGSGCQTDGSMILPILVRKICGTQGRITKSCRRLSILQIKEMEAMNRKHYMLPGLPLYGTIGSCRVVPCFLFSRRRVGESYGLEIHSKYKALFNGTIYQRIIRGPISFMAYARVQ